MANRFCLVRNRADPANPGPGPDPFPWNIKFANFEPNHCAEIAKAKIAFGDALELALTALKSDYRSPAFTRYFQPADEPPRDAGAEFLDDLRLVDVAGDVEAGPTRAQPGVAELAAAAARIAGLGEAEALALRRAGLLHDLGRVGISASVWTKPGPLTEREWEQVRLHPYYTERILARLP